MSVLATALGALPTAVGDGAVAPVVADFSQDVFWVWLLKAVAIIVFLLTSVLIAIWFERRVVGRMQLRPGPNVHGPFGLLQSLADAMKLLVKEDVTVKAADKLVYILAPMIAVLCSLLVFAVIPFGPEVSIFGVVTPLQLTDFSVAVLYILACAAVGVYGIVLGGWSSNSTYPLLGGVRSTAQVISYELAMGLSLVSVFIMAGSMSTSQIVDSQTQVWWFLPLLPAFVIYLISMVGETNRLPFDLPEAEGELVGGYTTEYSSMKFAWFFLAEYINMLNVSAVATTLFFGGWRAPWPISAINDGMFNTGWWPVLWFVAKVWLFMFVFVWIRGSVLRFRYDQFMKIGWKVLIPAALLWVVCVTFVQAARQLWDVDLRTLLFFLAGLVVVGLVASFLVPEKKPEPAPEPTGPQEFDPFENGYPVPPLPGQVLPPSPRAQRRLAATQPTDPSGPETPLEVRGG
ncbi:NADH-quinone oxidoreductase subunit NuoH [Cellulomonas xiejunii]|uniref:NADH-quinone oxidoreductase subunit H n=1 Tax=Cellulomonas xiejunii TaxID=2968083 RepID=A0ABY5KP31_9CELL|nr:NADH-quinone oxidoreductase subunit NuoH [Cellulomonas xiejunii]MCC2316235.1 NADH-quinone oxidoreductase subunit NuoH [Cellulomonas xiejunii]MCC2320548.1 NADH-quinone oxidoreductase subunit NuoH [Cellulomonas xiejunii]UUI70840.1 NADH-quinone oxidoreductase subunit NuoH [Cellulomonas xiejunii]